MMEILRVLQKELEMASTLTLVGVFLAGWAQVLM